MPGTQAVRAGHRAEWRDDVTQTDDGARLASHYSVLVYPFVHAIDADSRWVRLRQLHDVWQPWWHRLASREEKYPNIPQAWEQQPAESRGPEPKIENVRDDREVALDDSFFLLPRIRELLFPESATPAA